MNHGSEWPHHVADSHAHLQVDFLGAITNDRRVMVVTEFMAGGSLDELLASPTGPRLTFFRAAQIADDICHALSYLHHHPVKVLCRDEMCMLPTVLNFLCSRHLYTRTYHLISL